MPIELGLIVLSLVFIFCRDWSAHFSVIVKAATIVSVLFLVIVASSTPSIKPLILSALLSSFVLFVGLPTTSKSQSVAEPRLTGLILVAALSLIYSNSFLSLVFSFEAMTAAALALFKVNSKFDRSSEALFEMYFWAMVGSVLLVTSVAISNLTTRNYVFGSTMPIFPSLISIAGFSIKVPLWPFSSWLLKAHVEASTEFSIFLSGFLVKFGVFSIWKLSSSCSQQVSDIVLSLSYIGIIDGALRLVSQVDLKRVVASLTVIEANWMMSCLMMTFESSLRLGCWLAFIHCCSTTSEFFLVEVIYKRFGTRSIPSITGLWSSHPIAAAATWAVSLNIIGLPGTGTFAAKVMFFVNLFSESPVIALIFGVIFFVVVPVFIVRITSSIVGGFSVSKARTPDLSLTEATVLIVPILVGVVVGFLPGLMF